MARRDERASRIRGENDVRDLEELLDRLGDVGDEARDDVTLEAVVGAVGRRSFGPLLVVAGLLAFSPLSGIPGVPSAIGILVVVVAATMPPLEVVPFSATIAGGILLIFGLALIAGDGLLGLLAFALTAGGLAMLSVNLFGAG